MTITFSGCIASLLATKDPHPFLGPSEVRHLLVLRGLVGFFSVYGGYVALQRLKLTDVTAIGFLSPICTAIMGAIFLGEHFRLREAVAACLSLAGVVLIVKPQLLFKYLNHGCENVLSSSMSSHDWISMMSPFGYDAMRDDGITDRQRLVSLGYVRLPSISS